MPKCPYRISGSDPSQRDLLNKMIAAKRDIGMAVELSQTISRDENERARFHERRKFQMDMEHSVLYSHYEAILAKMAPNLQYILYMKNLVFKILQFITSIVYCLRLQMRYLFPANHLSYDQIC